MNRRQLFKGLGAIVAGIAIEEAIPLGRVWSFPSQVVRPEGLSIRTVLQYDITTETVRRFDVLYGYGPTWPTSAKIVEGSLVETRLHAHRISG